MGGCGCWKSDPAERHSSMSAKRDNVVSSVLSNILDCRCQGIKFQKDAFVMMALQKKVKHLTLYSP